MSAKMNKKCKKNKKIRNLIKVNVKKIQQNLDISIQFFKTRN